jgi:hypothetical protein
MARVASIFEFQVGCHDEEQSTPLPLLKKKKHIARHCACRYVLLLVSRG